MKTITKNKVVGEGFKENMQNDCGEKILEFFENKLKQTKSSTEIISKYDEFSKTNPNELNLKEEEYELLKEKCKNYSPVSNLLDLFIRRTKTCSNCKTPEQSLENYKQLLLDIPKVKGEKNNKVFQIQQISDIAYKTVSVITIKTTTRELNEKIDLIFELLSNDSGFIDARQVKDKLKEKFEGDCFILARFSKEDNQLFLLGDERSVRLSNLSECDVERRIRRNS